MIIAANAFVGFFSNSNTHLLLSVLGLLYGVLVTSEYLKDPQIYTAEKYNLDQQTADLTGNAVTNALANGLVTFFFVWGIQDVTTCISAFVTSAVAALATIAIAGFRLLSSNVTPTLEEKLMPLYYAAWSWWVGTVIGVALSRFVIGPYLRDKIPFALIEPGSSTSRVWIAFRVALGCFCLLWPASIIIQFHFGRIPEPLVISNWRSFAEFGLPAIVWMAGFLSNLSVLSSFPRPEISCFYVLVMTGGLSMILFVSCCLPPENAKKFSLALDVMVGVYGGCLFALLLFTGFDWLNWRRAKRSKVSELPWPNNGPIEQV